MIDNGLVKIYYTDGTRNASWDGICTDNGSPMTIVGKVICRQLGYQDISAEIEIKYVCGIVSSLPRTTPTVSHEENAMHGRRWPGDDLNMCTDEIVHVCTIAGKRIALTVARSFTVSTVATTQPTVTFFNAPTLCHLKRVTIDFCPSSVVSSFLPEMHTHTV